MPNSLNCSWLDPEAVEAIQNVKEGRSGEEKMGRLLRNLDHDFLREIKDQATAEALVEKMFGTVGD
jgi:hypothetical protein